MKLLLYIGTLASGGAERQLTQIATGLAQRDWTVHVVTMFPGGKYEARIDAATGVTREVLLGAKASNQVGVFRQMVEAPRRLRRSIDRQRPDVVYSFMDMCNLHARLALGREGSARLCWGVRASDMKLRWFQDLARRWCGRMSPAVGALIANSRAGRDHFEQLGFRCHRAVVLHNGIDTGRFRPRDRSEAAALRGRWDGGRRYLIGHVGRITPMKDHATFLAAARAVVDAGIDASFVCVGGGRAAAVERLRSRIAALGLDDRVTLAGEFPDMPLVYGALDLMVSSSAYGEGFPNVLGEAQASGLPCVVTDVGDSAVVVGPADPVVPPSRPDLLATGILQALAGTGLDAAARHERVAREFNVDLMLERTEQVLREVAG